MNNPLQNQIPNENQPMADKLASTAKAMQISPTFQSQLETQLMNAYASKKQPSLNWFTKLTVTLSWAVAGLAGIFFLSWAIRSLLPSLTPAQESLPAPEVSFENGVRNGDVCTAPLALAHGFTAYLSNTDKTKFLSLDAQKTIGELRSFAWSPDGQRLAVVGNTTGTGNIYLTDSTGKVLQPVIPNSELGYLMDVSWSQDGERLLTWEIQDNTTVYLVQQDGTGLEEIKLGAQIFETPKLTPDNAHIVFFGATSTVSGLLEFGLTDQNIRVISGLVEDESSFAWSPDGTHLAYMEMDREQGEARLVAEEFATGNKTPIATLPISKGSGASIPSSANLHWSSDGTWVVFEFGGGVTGRAIFLAYADGSGLIQFAEQAYAPALSEDGCLAYISNKQIFLVELSGTTSTSASAALLLGDLPQGRAISDFRLDKLEWGSHSKP